MKVLIIGAGSTLAQTIIKKLLAEGSSVLGILHGDIRPDMEKIEYIPSVNAADHRQMAELEERILRDFGSPDQVINCAGLSEYIDFIEGDPEDFYRVFSVNYNGSVNACRLGARLMKDRGGAITLVGSGYGQRHIPYLSSYCASKGALSSLVKVLSVELALRGVRINLVTPGIFPSQMTEPFLSNKKYTDQLINHIPDRRFGTAEGVADAILFLGSPAASHINGTELTVDGGMLNLIEGGIVR